MTVSNPTYGYYKTVLSAHVYTNTNGVPDALVGSFVPVLATEYDYTLLTLSTDTPFVLLPQHSYWLVLDIDTGLLNFKAFSSGAAQSGAATIYSNSRSKYTLTDSQDGRVTWAATGRYQVPQVVLKGLEGAVAPPIAPVNLAVNAEESSVLLTWKDKSSSETGFNIYRDGVLLETVAADSTHYTDIN